jgi:hypothetical protein
MKNPLTITLIFFLTLLTGCKREMTYFEFEKSVMEEIFPELIDQTCVDQRLFTYPPPKYGLYIYDKNGNNTEIDTSKASKLERITMRKWENRRDSILNDTSKVVIAFDPVLKNTKESVEEDFKKHFPNAELYKPEKDKTEYTFEYQDIKLNGKFKLKDINEFPIDRDTFWEKNYAFVFSGVINFTRIQFDTEKKYGVLDGGFLCGRLCGQGFRIYIKKKDGKWIIDEIQGTWVS